LLGGLILFVTTLYCGPRTRTGRGRGRAGAGLYPELAAFGFAHGDSPALVSHVGRQCALLPSYAIARRELATQGTPLNIKTVHRLARQLGAEALTARTRDLLRWRDGLVVPGTELAGKRVAAQIDGGRTRLRTVTRKQQGRGKTKRQRRRYQADWREPKLLIIYEIDAQGRMQAGTRAWIDGTFGGPDEALELLAFHLHRLGAAQAEVVVFAADGAPWIWERLDWVRQRVGLAAAKVRQVLDWCHALHHVSLALEALGLAEPKRGPLYRKLRRWLRRGWPGLVVRELEKRGEARRPWPQALDQPLGYLTQHMQAGHLAYDQLRRQGLPQGSGAVESAIRRVINLRLKGPGLMWRAENAEGALVLRAAAVTDRWEETMAWVREMMGPDGRVGWSWTGPDMTAELKAETPIKPPVPQAVLKQRDREVAA
jgi:hypothetical protein